MNCNYSVATVPRGVLARNCEGTEQLRMQIKIVISIKGML